MDENERNSRISDFHEDDIEATDLEMRSVAQFAVFLLVGLLGMAGMMVCVIG